MRNLTRPQLIGVISGLLIFFAYQFMFTMAGTVKLERIFSGQVVVVEEDIANPNLYLLSGALFFFILFVVVIILASIVEEDRPTPFPNSSAYGMLAFSGVFILLWFPISLLTQNIVLTMVLIISPMFGIFAGRELGKRFRQQRIIPEDEGNQMMLIVVVIFLVCNFLARSLL